MHVARCARSSPGSLPSLRARGARSGREVPKGPAGLDFYTPPADDPKGTHGTAIGSRTLTGKAVLKSAKSNRLLLYARRRPTATTTRAVSGTVARPEGQGAEGRLAGRHLGARHDRHRRRVRALDRRHARAVRQPAAQLVAEGRLRGRAHRLRGPRHARRTHPYLIGVSEGRGDARHGPRRAQARREDRQEGRDRRPLAGRARRAVGGLAREASGRRSSSCAARSRSRRPATSASRPRCSRALTHPSALSGLAAMIVRGIDVEHQPSLNVAALLSDRAQALYPQVDQVCLGDLSARPTRSAALAPVRAVRARRGPRAGDRRARTRTTRRR